MRFWRGRAYVVVSADGYIARPDGDVSWRTRPPALGRRHEPGMGSRAAHEWATFAPVIDHVVMGRGSYERRHELGMWCRDAEQIVLSTSMPDGPIPDGPGVPVVRCVDEAAAWLNQVGAREVFVQGATVLPAFLRRGFIDELTIATMPVLLGGGIPLWASDRDLHLELRATHGTDDGVVHATYRVL